jgi:hypothetical protein
VATIPGEDVTGRALQFYVEAVDATGAVINSLGSATEPNILIIGIDEPGQPVTD